MKKGNLKKYLFISLGILLLTLSLFGVKFILKNYLLNSCYHTNEQVLGIVDRNDLNRTLPANPIICYTAVLNNTALWSRWGDLETVLKNHDVLITVETWLKGLNYKNNVLTEVVNGSFDKQIKGLAILVANSRHRVFIRWNPDMEVPTNIYPWQFKAPKDYINAFHYFSKKIKIYAPNAQIIWGPQAIREIQNFGQATKLLIMQA